MIDRYYFVIDSINKSLNNQMIIIEREEESLITTIITTIIKKKHFEKKRENLLIMQLAIHSDRQNVMNAIDAMSINNQSASETPSRNFAQIKTKLNTKMSKIRKLYESRKKNLSKIMS